jgi:hypothetical protein
MPATNSGKRSNTMLVRSPPSSKIMLSGFPPSNAKRVCSMHQSNSSSFMPFQAYTGYPAAAIAAAAWSCVEKMLHEDQVTSAPNAFQCFDKHSSLDGHVKATCNAGSFQRLAWAKFLREATSNRAFRPLPSSISLRPYSAREMSFTLYFNCVAVFSIKWYLN